MTTFPFNLDYEFKESANDKSKTIFEDVLGRDHGD
jgi:hypothetical protein